ENPDDEKSGQINPVLKAIPGALPSVSSKLLEKAAQLKSGQLSEADIKRLADAARALSQDLGQLAQSKELRQAVEEMAKQIKPEQLEQVARELAKHEDLKRELEATARMLAENQQARELITGLAEAAQDLRQKFRSDSESPDARGQSARGGQSPDVPGKGGKNSDTRGQTLAANQPAISFSGAGRDVRASGKLNREGQGHYLFLETRPGTSPARVPYSSAYPQYRREAERFVDRSQIPANMKNLVRDYFSAINPDEHK